MKSQRQRHELDNRVVSTLTWCLYVLAVVVAGIEVLYLMGFVRRHRLRSRGGFCNGKVPYD